MSRAEYEKRVTRIMIELFCRDHHAAAAPCDACRELEAYCARRIDRCPQGARKSSCRKCTIHCYDASHRQRIGEVMRYAGPRMLFRHPIATLRHLFYEWCR